MQASLKKFDNATTCQRKIHIERMDLVFAFPFSYSVNSTNLKLSRELS